MGVLKIFWVFWVFSVLFRPAFAASVPEGTSFSSTSQIAHTDVGPSPKRLPKKKRIGSCGFLLSLVAIGAMASTYLSPALYHEMNARVQQADHVGHGIYLDWDTILAKLTEEERRLVREVGNDPEAVVHLFTSRLGGTGSEEPAGWSWFPRSRNASDYLDQEYSQRGSCRHRASILVAILNHLGLDAELRDGNMREVGRHLWVYIPSLDLAADAYAGVVVSAEEYHQGFDPESVQKPSSIHRFVAGTFY